MAWWRKPKQIHGRITNKTLDVPQELAKSFDELASKAILSIYEPPFNPFHISLQRTIADLKHLPESTECYDCDGKGWEPYVDHFDSCVDNNLSIEIFGEDYEPENKFWVMAEIPSFNEHGSLLTTICPWCDGKGIDNDN